MQLESDIRNTRHLEQPFIKNPDITIKDLLISKIAELGENMIIRRSTRYMVGEDLGE